MATPARTRWHHQDPELWPSITQASALLLALEALARLQEHLALITDDRSRHFNDRRGGTPAAARFPPPRGRNWLRW